MITKYLAKSKEDLEYIASLYSNPKNNKYLIRKSLSVEDLEKLSKLRSDYILEINQEKIGWFFIKKNVDNTARFAIIIDSQFQGKGYGKQAMELIEQESKDLGASKIILEVFVENKVARNLYEGMGFEEVANLMHMEKEVK